MKSLILFDIDGTILNFRHGIAKELFAEMLKELFGREIPDSAIPNFHGMTDLQIIKSITENIGMSYNEALDMLPEIWRKMFVMFEAHSVPENITVLPGVYELLEELHKRSDTCLGLITGNFEDNAYLKLSVAGLDKYFPTGAFGSDSEDRNLLPPIAIARINKYYESDSFDSANTVIIGDTLRDIECAKKNNIKVLAVATGGCTENELMSHNPDRVLKSLEDTQNTIDIIYSLINVN